MSSLTSIIPVVRSLPCGGQMVKVAEFRLRDLAELQAILDGLTPDPWEAIRAEIAAGPAPQRRAELIADAWERAEKGPAQMGTPEGNAYFCTPEGASLVLWMATRRDTPEMMPALAVNLFVAATPSEIAIIWRAAYGISTLEAMEKHVFAPELLARGSGGGSTTSWPEAIDEVAQQTGWTYSQIYDMTISEFGYVRRGGREKESGVVLKPGQDWAALQETQRRWFYGEAGPSPEVGSETG